jgi:hypothetical protein
MIVVIALVARAAVAAAVDLTGTLGQLAPDSQTYLRLAADRASGAFVGWGASDAWLYRRVATYVFPVALLFRVFGAHVGLAQFISAIYGAAAAAATCSIAARVFERRWALIAGLIVALLPSQVLWSSLVLRDSAAWVVAALIGLCAARGQGERSGRRLFMWGCAITLLLVVMSGVRLHSMIVLAWALVPAMLLSSREGWATRVGGAVAIALVVPFALNQGVGGLDFVRGRDLGVIRGDNAAGAESAFVGTASGSTVATVTSHDVRRRATPTRGEGTAVLVGLRYMLVEPIPWANRGGRLARLAGIEMIVWYPMLLLAGAGVTVAVRRRIRALAFPVTFGVGIVTAYALVEGNLGTAFRHRGEAVWPIALLAAVGAEMFWRESARRADALGRRAQ